MSAVINSVSMPSVVDAGQTFTLSVSVTFNPLIFNDIEDKTWSVLDDGATTWIDIDKDAS